ncbi:MAG: CBS domain-containing protein [Halobacteria archaeon]|nr:CBS domain-containing protein [Halobacteria archaeon]
MRSYKVGRIMGIDIKIHLSLLVLLPLLAWLISREQQITIWTDIISGFYPHTLTTEPLLSGNAPLIIGGVAAVGLFAGVTVHELGHSWVARQYGLTISSITLWIFGGMANMDENPDEWNVEFWMALAGPVTSVLISGIFMGILQLLPASTPPVAVFVVGWLAMMNLALAVFNMLPAFPMDGGRVFRALLARSRPYVEATQIAASVGKFFAVGMGILGVLSFNPLLVLIALFVYVAATSESRMAVVSDLLQDVKVSDLMTTEVKTVPRDISVNDLANRMLTERHTGYPVVDGTGSVVGIVTLTDIKEVDEVERDAYTAGDIMTHDVISVDPGDDAFEVLRTLGQNDIGRVLVEADGEVVGILSRTDLVTALEVLQGGSLRTQSMPQV